MTLLQAAFFQFGFAKDDDKANKNSEGRFRRVMSNCMESDRDHQPFGYLQKKSGLCAVERDCCYLYAGIDLDNFSDCYLFDSCLRPCRLRMKGVLRKNRELSNVLDPAPR